MPPTGALELELESGLEFVYLRGGSFTMGCATNDTRCDTSEMRREVKVRGFWIGRTEVTVAAWRRCMAAGACQPFPEPDPDGFGSEDSNYHQGLEEHPINGISFEFARDFCRWIGGRVPTGVEWEYAAKGGEDRVYPWGDDPPDATRTNYCERQCRRATAEVNVEAYLSGKGTFDDSQDDGWAKTAPVGTFPAGATPHGVLDMAGNLFEWTADDAPTPGWKIIRGGSWRAETILLRASNEFQVPPSQKGNLARDTQGFRCVR